MVAPFIFKNRDGQTPLPLELRKGLKKNNIQTVGELDEYEEQNIAEGIAWLNKCTADCTSYDFWLKLHKKLFGEVWDWAGRVRKNELHNPDFLEPHKIWPAFKQLEGDLKYWLLHNTFGNKEIAARFHEKIETIHPFANGNGRFGRIVVEYFCKKNSFEIPRWGSSLAANPKNRRKTYISGLEIARKGGSYEELVNFMFS